ncbi:2-iminobutanoate/2-iminopropanoate deaminase [Chitinophaga costaii]|uniref:2-iminobutanoate/2-iminopropanoate deaminase n=1 Tax=Chitinophaga costaii TaxID=1335309 RepID=A0A1C4FRE1_9BACT|nr:RidA family protein [Chitinophaga costaii]PUZ20488.1 RidA family protein [Chitinophaga costaii]SCC58520.1 2-iminobutanoate/2-iminopropanoate deaminase [Chitinophaga costaii]
MEKQIIQSSNAPAPIGPYSQAVKAGGFVFVSGQVPIDPATGNLVTGDIATETTQVMENLKAVLTAANLTFNDVIKTTIFLTKMSNFAAVNEVYGQYFSDNFPARETVEVSGLPKGVNVEISVIAGA